MNSSLSRVEAWSLLTLSTACVGIIVNTFQGDGEPLIASLAFSGIAFSFTFSLIRWLGDTFIKANLKGRDMSKLKRVEMYEILHYTLLLTLIFAYSPETMGAVCAVVYLLVIIVFIPFPFYKDIVAATSGGGNREFVVERQQVETGRILHRFPHNKVCTSRQHHFPNSST